jgi:hypothetical protein
MRKKGEGFREEHAIAKYCRRINSTNTQHQRSTGIQRLTEGAAPSRARSNKTERQYPAKSKRGTTNGTNRKQTQLLHRILN